jgi:excisionase family DNA binding protein
VTAPDKWDEAPDLLTPAEVCALLRISRTTCYGLIRSDVLGPIAFHMSRSIRIPKAQLRALVEKGGDRD